MKDIKRDKPTPLQSAHPEPIGKHRRLLNDAVPHTQIKKFNKKRKSHSINLQL